MRTTTASFDAAKVKTSLRVHYIAELGATPLYISNKVDTIGTITPAADVISFGPIANVNHRVSGGEVVSRSSLVLRYTPDIQAACIPGTAVKIKIGFLGEGLAAADLLQIFSGTISEPILQTGETITITLESDSEYKNAVIGDLLNSTESASADPDDLGKTKPIIYGTVKGSTCLATDAGSLTKLALEIADTETTITVTDTSRFPSTGTIQIDEEQITYTGTNGTQFTGATRGANGTTAAGHDAGAIIGEIQTDYEYLIADHAITSVADVYVDGVRQESEAADDLDGAVDAVVTTITVTDASDFPAKGRIVVDSEQVNYTGVSGNDLTGCTRGANGTTAASHADAAAVVVYDHRILINDGGQAKVIFSTLPTLKKSSTIEVNDGIGVSDTIGVDSTTTAEIAENLNTTTSPFSYSSSAGITTLAFSKSGLSSNSVSGTVAMTDPILVSGTWCGTQTWDIQARFRRGSGTYSSWKVIYRIKCSGCCCTAGCGPGLVGGSGAIAASGDWDDIQLRWVGSGSPPTVQINVLNATLTRMVDGDVTSTKTGAASKTGTVTLTGSSVSDTVIGAQVSVDCTGYAGDRPDEVVEHLLLNYGNGIAAGDLDSSVTDGAAVYGANYNISARIDKPTDLMVLCREIAYQSASRFFWDSGKAYLVKFPTTASAVDVSLTEDDLIFDQIELGFTPFSDIYNKITARYDYRADQPEYSETYDAEDTASQTSYGVRDQSTKFNFTRMQDATAVTNATDDYITRYGKPKQTARIRLPLAHCDIQRGDIIQIYYYQVGLKESARWEVMSQSIVPGSAESFDTVELILESITEINVGSDYIELEASTDELLLETGDHILLESA